MMAEVQSPTTKSKREKCLGRPGPRLVCQESEFLKQTASATGISNLAGLLQQTQVWNQNYILHQNKDAVGFEFKVEMSHDLKATNHLV